MHTLLRHLPALLVIASLPAALLAEDLGGTPGAEPSLALAADPVGMATLASLTPTLARFGLDGENRLDLKEVEREASGVSHVRFQQRYRGLRVWGGQAIAHQGPRGPVRPLTNALVPNLQLEVTPNLAPGEAMAVAQARLGPKGSYARPPTWELLIYPETTMEPAIPGAENAEDFRVALVRHHLAYHIHMELENGPEETRHDDFLVDAHSGAILKVWSSLFTLKGGTPAITTGHSQYSGDVQLGSLSMPCGYILSDPTRNNLATRNLGGRTSGTGVLFNSPVPEWGDSRNYQDHLGPKSANGQTAAVDAHFGLQTTWDFYRNVLGRNGIDGRGKPAVNLVHYSHNYDNAFWSDECFCMTYGDGDSFKTLTAIDVVGHEISHGLCHTTADLGYVGETGGLNEANSDIFGTMISFYAKGAQGLGPSVPEQGGRWSIGYDLQTPAYPHPLRYMNKPSLDGFSPDAWSSDLDEMDVHYSSGPMNRAFYFLSQGASSNRKDDSYTRFLPKGMTGIGNDKALRIWWRTLSCYLTPGSRYVDARNGALATAQDLYGANSLEVKAVRAAFKGINVGKIEPKAMTIELRSRWSSDPVPMDTSD